MVCGCRLRKSQTLVCFVIQPRTEDMNSHSKSSMPLVHEMSLWRGLSVGVSSGGLATKTDSIAIPLSGGLTTETDKRGRPSPGRPLYTEYTQFTHLYTTSVLVSFQSKVLE